MKQLLKYYKNRLCIKQDGNDGDDFEDRIIKAEKSLGESKGENKERG